MFNIVELAAADKDCAFDQPCKYGHRVESHAVYCHNDEWKEGPRKCRRTWYKVRFGMRTAKAFSQILSYYHGERTSTPPPGTFPTGIAAFATCMGSRMNKKN